MPLSVGLEQLLMLMLIDSLWHRTKRAPSATVGGKRLTLLVYLKTPWSCKNTLTGTIPSQNGRLQGASILLKGNCKIIGLYYGTHYVYCPAPPTLPKTLALLKHILLCASGVPRVQHHILCSSFKQRVHLSSLVSPDVTSIRDVTLRIAKKNPRPEAAYIHPNILQPTSILINLLSRLKGPTNIAIKHGDTLYGVVTEVGGFARAIDMKGYCTDWHY
eukprot:scaffold1833_cov145-Skeletonema_marinoi.AAC.1